MFLTTFIEVLNKHAPLRKKSLRANHTPYITKTLRKAIMRKSQLESQLETKLKLKLKTGLKPALNYAKNIKNFVVRCTKGKEVNTMSP